jgi:hypothetical protein
MPPIRVRKAGTKAIFVRKGRVHQLKAEAAQTKVPGQPPKPNTTHAHDLPSVPVPLLPVLRKPLQAYHKSTSRKVKRRIRQRETKFLRALTKRIEDATKSWQGSPVHPIAVLAWLSSEEPFNAEFLLENATALTDETEEVDPVFAAELDNLLDRFHDSQITDAPSSQENPLIEVPKDFSMITTPSAAEGLDMDVMMTEWSSSEDDRQSLNGFERSAAKRKGTGEVGFDPVQILKKHAIQFQTPDCPQTSDLNCDIHPLFREENFHGCPEHIYEVFKPGLRLATLLLSHKATASFWHALIFGQRTEFKKQGTAYSRIREEVPWTQANSDAFSNMLSQMANSVHFHFSLWPSERNKGVWTYGSMHAIRDYKSGYLPKPNERCRQCRICMHTDFYITAKRLSLLSHRDPAMVLRFNFFFAVNICHEMAHFLEMGGHHMRFFERWATDLQERYPVAYNSGEAFMFDYPWNEMGQAFETRIFGGIVKPICSRMDCAHGLTTYEEPGLDAHGRLSTVRTFYTVPMDFVATVQQRKTWERAETMADPSGLFRIPRDGAQAVHVPYFDLTIWKDRAEQQVSDSGRSTPFLRTPDGIVRMADKTSLE